MVFEIVLSSSPGALAATQRHASRQWRISRRNGLRSRPNPFGDRTKTETPLFIGTIKLERIVTASPTLNWNANLRTELV
jgi:hypothetical protein